MQRTSSVTQIPGPIDAGSYEEATMNITLAQTAEGECDTTTVIGQTNKPRHRTWRGRPLRNP